MAKADFEPSDDRFIRGIIRRKAKQLVRRAGFTEQDREDLEQDLFVRVLQSLPQFKPERAHRNKFVTTVVERYVANIVRNRRAKKRCQEQLTSLSVTIQVTDEGPTELAQTIGHRELDSRLSRERRSEDELVQLVLDLAELTSTLPDAWQTLLKLRKALTMSEIADAMGVPRTTLNGWLRHIRQRFEKSGLQDYFESRSSSRT